MGGQAEREALESVRTRAREWLGGDEAEFKFAWNRVIQATTDPKTDDEMRVDPQTSTCVDLAVREIAYAHVHLQTIADAICPSAGGLPMTPVSANTTSESTVATSLVTGHSFSESPVPLDFATGTLLIHRAYIEWALVLARKLSQALSRSEGDSNHPTDVLAAHLIEDSTYRLPGLDSEMIRRINKRPIHMVYFDDPDAGNWQVHEIASALKSAVEELLRDLEESRPERARMLRDKIKQFESELAR